MRRLKEIYPQYSDTVAFYAVGTDPTESLERMEKYRERQGYPWPVAQAGQGMLKEFRVLTQSTKVAFNAQGIIKYRDTYGRGDAETWKVVFQELEASRR